jgi:hypothetical protein
MGTSRSKWKPLIIAVMLVTLDCILAPHLLAQQDVHASLIPAAERKMAPSFHLISN